MFKINPIRQAIFEGFFQRITAIDRDPATPLPAEFLTIPVFCETSIDPSTGFKQGGWEVMLRDQRPNQRYYEFYPDRAKQTLVTGSYDVGNFDSYVDIKLSIPIPTVDKISGSQDYSTRNIFDLTAVVWIEYLLPQVENDEGVLVEASEARTSSMWFLDSVSTGQLDPYDNPLELTLKMNSRNFNGFNFSDEYQIPYIDGVRIHYAVQCPIFSGMRSRAGITPYFNKVDVAPYEMVIEPPSDLTLKGGLPTVHVGGQYGVLIKSRTNKGLTRSAKYKGFAGLNLQTIDDRVFSNGAFAMIHKTDNPENYKYSQVFNTRSNANYFGMVWTYQDTQFSQSERRLDLTSYRINLPFDTLDADLEIETYDTSGAYPRPETLVSTYGSAVSFLALDGAEFNDTYIFDQLPADEGSLYRSSNNITYTYKKITGNEIHTPNFTGVTDSSGWHLQYKVNQDSILRVEYPNLDTEINTTVNCVDRYMISMSSTVDQPPVVIGKIRPFIKEVTFDNLNIDPRNAHRTPMICVNLGYWYDLTRPYSYTPSRPPTPSTPAGNTTTYY